MMKRILHGFIILAVAAAAIAVIMLLWNAIIPTVIGWASINYWQAGGLFILCKILFGGMGGRRFHGRHFGGRHMGHMGMGCGHEGGRDPHQLREEMKGMSRSERRDYIHQRMNEHFGDCRKKDTDTEGTKD